MTVNLHELINTPGYGSAAKVIGPPDEGERKYVVNVYGSIDISEAVVVTAKNRDEAIKLAKRESNILSITGTDIIE